MHEWYNLVVFLVGSRAISYLPPPASRGNMIYFYISRPIYFGRLVLFFFELFCSQVYPKIPQDCRSSFCNEIS